MRVTFRHLSGREEGRKDHFPPRRIVIGRDPECDLCFDLREDLEVSGRHAEVVPAADSKSWWIVDLESTNGTWINGNEIDGKAPLSSGDRIELGAGGPRLLFVIRRAWWKRLLGR
ncbi:MAG: FHA domain-containing protein [Planctomycetota bacterium]